MLPAPSAESYHAWSISGFVCCLNCTHCGEKQHTVDLAGSTCVHNVHFMAFPSRLFVTAQPGRVVCPITRHLTNYTYLSACGDLPITCQHPIAGCRHLAGVAFGATQLTRSISSAHTRQTHLPASWRPRQRLTTMADRYQAWIEGAAAERPHLAAPLATLGDLYHRKLWHQLTEQLEQCIDLPEFQKDGFLVALYHNFVSGFAQKINQLKLAFFAAAVSKHFASAEVGFFMATLDIDIASQAWLHPAGGLCFHPERRRQPAGQQTARHRSTGAVLAHATGAVRAGAGPPPGATCPPACGKMFSSGASEVVKPFECLQDCKRAFEAGREDLETLTDVSQDAALVELLSSITSIFTVCLAALQVDPQVSASVYYTASLYHKQQKEYAHYYRQAASDCWAHWPLG